MAIEYTDLANAYKSEMVGGDLILFIDGERVIAGRKHGPSFTYSEKGSELAGELEKKVAAEALAAATAASADAAAGGKSKKG